MVAIGIDFGTSTTVVAAAHGGRLAVVPSPGGEDVIPSVVSFLPSGRVIFGASARARRLIDPENSLFAVKRVLGRHMFASEVKAFQKQYPVAIESGADNQPRFVTRAGKLSAAEVASYLLAHLREYPELLGQSFDAVTMTVPTTFRDEQRAALTEAAERAGFRGVHLVDEPSAVAIDYLHDADRTSQETVVVYDLGGGTFDFSVLRSGPQGAHVMASGGDAYLGGEDIDQRLAGRVADDVLASEHWDIRTSAKSYQTLLYVCEQAKVRLSQTEETIINLAPVDEVLRNKTMAIHRRQLEELASDLVRRTFVVCDSVLGDAGVKASQVDRVLLCGGGAYMPAVRSAVEVYFGRAPQVAVRPDQVVARGAAWLASLQQAGRASQSPLLYA